MVSVGWESGHSLAGTSASGSHQAAVRGPVGAMVVFVGSHVGGSAPRLINAAAD